MHCHKFSLVTFNLGNKPSRIFNKAYKLDQRVVKAMLNEQEAPMLFATRRASWIKRVVIAMLSEQEAPK